MGDLLGRFPKVYWGELRRSGGWADEDVVGGLGFLAAVGAGWGGGFVDSILIGLEFGAVGGAEL